MWSLTSKRERRTSGPENFRPSAKRDFFNTIRQKRSYTLSSLPANLLQVTDNFRSRGQILDHVNRCFEERLSAQEAGYVALQSTRTPAQHGFPCVTKVSVQLPPETRVDSSRDEEARAVAEVCARLIGNVELKLNDGETRRLTSRPRPRRPFPGHRSPAASPAADSYHVPSDRHQRTDKSVLPYGAKEATNCLGQNRTPLVSLSGVLAGLIKDYGYETFSPDGNLIPVNRLDH
jgi:hypothetical protein